MPEASTIFLASLAATTFAVAGLCFFGYDAHLRRERLHHRVDLSRDGREPEALRHPTEAQPQAAHRQTIRWLAALHLPAYLAARLFVVLRLASAVVLAAVLAILDYRYAGVRAWPSLFGIGLVGGVLGWWLPKVAAERVELHRRRAVLRGLPDAIELMVIAVEAGLSLEEAINRIVVELRRSQPAVAEELAATSADLKILPDRDEALRRLAERVNLPSMRSVVTTLLQTLRYGTPLAQALRVVAAELRNDALLKLEEQANRMPVMLTIPMVLFILPSLFLIIGGPAFLNVLDVFRDWHH